MFISRISMSQESIKVFRDLSVSDIALVPSLTNTGFLVHAWKMEIR